MKNAAPRPGHGYGFGVPTAFNIFTSSACTCSFPHTTFPVFSASSSPLTPLTMPPASRTMMVPAARSQGCKLRSQ